MSSLPKKNQRRTKPSPERPEDLWLLLGHLPGAAYRCQMDAGRTVTFISEGCRELTGYGPEDLVDNRAASFTSLIVDEDRPQVDAKIWADLRRQRTYALEYRLRDRFGHVKTVWDQGVASVGPDGSTETLEGFIWDVTDRKRVEKLQSIAHRIAYSANRGLSLQALFRYIHSELSAILEISNIYIALYDRSRESILFPYYVDENYQGGPRVRSRKLGHGLTEYVLRTGKALIADGEQIKKLAEAGEIEILGPLPQTWLGAPLKTENNTVGVIAIQSYSPSTLYNRSDLELLEFASGQIAAVIERKRSEESLAARERQNAVMAELGRKALSGATLDELLGAAVSQVAEALEVDFAEVLELQPESDSFLLRAGVGWKEGTVGVARVGAGADSQAGYTLVRNEAVIVEDLAAETRFHGPDLLLDHGVASGVCVPIPGPKRPFGVLGVHTTLKRAFTSDDAHFLQGVAGLLAEAILRQETESALRVSEGKFANMVSIAPDGIISFDESGRITLFNQAAERAFGYTSAEIVGKSMEVILPPDLRAREWPALAETLGQMVATTPLAPLEMRGLRKNGEQFPMEVSVSRLSVDQGVLYTAVMRDITYRKQNDERLRESEERFRKAFEYASTGKALVGVDGRFLRVNRTLCEMLGYTEQELLDRSFREVTHPEDLAMQVRLRQNLIEGNIPSFRIEKRYLHRQGTTVWAELSVSAVRDQSGKVLYLVTEVKDISEWKRFEAQLVHLANHDPLTNLFNRRRFQEELERQLAHIRRYGNRGAAMFLDLDQFKEVNDHLGHQAGDGLLVGIARVLRARLRETDTLARLGGDEFAIILPNADASQAAVVAEHLLEAVRGHSLRLAGNQVSVTTSLGIVLFPDHGTTADELLVRADMAMYQAKNAGGDRLAFYQPAGQATPAYVVRSSMEQRIRTALENGSFELHCQPILDLGLGKVSRYELLLRMRGDDGQLVYPAAFLDVAERSGLIRDIDRWVLHQAVLLLSQPKAAALDLHFEVNVSGKSFADGELLQALRHDLADTGVSPERLVLAASEAVVVANPLKAREFAQALKEIGCGFALDDFGSGFSSLMQVKNIPLDYLKIDGSFIQDLPRDSVDHHFVTALVGMARGMGKRTIAEFVGDDETVDLLRQCGVDYAQGFHLGRPVPVAQVLDAREGRAAS